MTNEIRLVSKGDSRLQWLAGLFYLDAESDSGGTVDTPDFFYRERTSDPIESEAMAVYGEVEYAFTETFSASLGMRFHDEERTNTSVYSATSFFPDFTYFSDPYFGPQGSGVTTTVEETSFDHTSYRVGLTWTPSENGMVYITQSTANRAPIILTANNRTALANAGIQQVGDVDAAELSNTELGTKWTLADGRLQVEAAYVIGDWQDIPLWAQVAVPGNPVSMPIGGTDADVTSAEVALTWAITDSLLIDYAYTYTDTKVTAVPDPGTVSNYPGAITKGGELYNYAPETHNIGVNWNRDNVVSGWDMYLSANYVTRDRVDGINPFTAPDAYVPARERYQNLMLNFGVTKGPWDVVFSVRNASGHDGQYLPRTSLGGGDAQLFGLIQQPTTYTLQVSYDGMP
jgi:iron complex outermembrane receptor protein